MCVEWLATSCQLTRSLVMAFWKPASWEGEYWVRGECLDSKKKSQSVISVGTGGGVVLEWEGGVAVSDGGRTVYGRLLGFEDDHFDCG